MGIINKIKSSDSIKNVTKISAGTMIGQAVSLVAVPIYTRIYGASILGIWAIINSIATIVTSFSDFGLKNALMIEKDDETEKLYTIITTVTMGFSIITGVLASLYYSFIDTSMDLNPIIIGLMIAMVTFLTPQTQTCYTWLNKQGKYNVLMKNPVIHNVSMAVIAIGLGLLGFKKYGYYIGVILGSIITIARMKYYLPKKMFNFNLDDYRYVIKTKKNFYLYQTPTNVLGQFKEQVPVFAIKLFFGVEMLGYYSISMKYLKVPINLLAQSIGRVFFRNVSVMAREGKSIGEYSFKNITRAIKLCCIPLILIYSVGDIACKLMFGSDYEIAGNIMRIVASNSFLMFLMVSCQGMTIVLGKQKQNMLTSILHICSYFGGIAFGYILTNNIYVSCAIMTVGYALIQGTFFGYLFKSSGVSVKRYIGMIAKYAVIIGAVAFCIRLILLLLGIVTHF